MPEERTQDAGIGLANPTVIPGLLAVHTRMVSLAYALSKRTTLYVEHDLLQSSGFSRRNNFPTGVSHIFRFETITCSYSSSTSSRRTALAYWRVFQPIVAPMYFMLS